MKTKMKKQISEILTSWQVLLKEAIELALDKLSAGLKIKHKNSQILYTLKSINKYESLLTTPEGDLILVPTQELLNDYELS